MTIVDRDLWQQIIQKVVASGGNIIRPWFTDLEPLSLDNGLLEIQTPGKQEKEYCEQHAARMFTEAAQAATGRLVGVCFLTADCDDNYVSDTACDESLDEPKTRTQKLIGDYTFSNFVTGPCNRLAHAAATAISDMPGTTYNPLFLHGSVGLGKTHILQAVCHKVTADNQDAKIEILSCEMFVNDFIAAVEKGQLASFRYRYRHLDVLAVDDIQFLANHEQTQEEFFHTFNTLYQANKQIILTCDRGPGEISDLEERLVSRFHWGLVAQIDKPCYETRLAIIHSKARKRNINLPQDVACFIASTIDSNTRELEGAIAKVAMLAQVADTQISLKIAEEALGTVPQVAEHNVTIEDILTAVITLYNVRRADLQSKKRSRSIAFPRQICMYLARRLTRHSLQEIGGYFGGRDHTTVLHANKTIQGMSNQDPKLNATLQKLSNQILAAQ